MKVALGVLGWTPETFWNATPHEFWAAVEGRLALNRGGGDAPLSAEDIATIEAMKRRFPDATAS